MTVAKKIRTKENIHTIELSKIHIGKDNIDKVLEGIVKEDIEPKFLVIDLFCGAGGTTTGFEMSDGIAKVIACVNHDPIAIISHWRNHPHVLHFEEDIRTIDLYCLQRIVDHYRKLYPEAIIILWASLECTNYSKAKGGQSRDGDSRTLACHLFRYIHALRPNYVQIENVVEFMSWGDMKPKVYKTKEGYEHAKFEYKYSDMPVISNDGMFVIENGSCKFERKFKPVFEGVPDSMKNGKMWLTWCKTMDREMNGHNHWKQLNSADFGAYTSRNRLFGCFAKNGLPIVWPEPTHAKKSKKGMFSDLKKWKPVKEVLDFEDEGVSIFNRRWNEQLRKQDRKELVEASLKRIYEGLIKHAAGGKDKFMVKYNSMSQKGKYVPPSVDEPCPVIPTQNRLGIAFITKYFSGKPEHKNISVEEPAGTIRTKDGQYLVQCPFIVQRNSGNPESKVASVDNPSRTLTGSGGNLELVQPDFLMKYYGNGDNTESINGPAGTISTKDRFAKLHASFLMKSYGNGHNTLTVNGPAGTIVNNDKHNLIDARFISNFQYNNNGISVDGPAPTLLASRHHYYIVNPSHGGHSTSVDDPCVVLIARQDKSPLYLLNIEHSPALIPIYEDDCETMIKIKEFMAMYGISDIKMRMLKIPELKKIQGFPVDYHLAGSQADQKKFIGNSVHPLMPKVWIKAMAVKIFKMAA